MQRILTIDSRKRLTLGGMAAHEQYVATSFPDGRIVLQPAVVLTTAEAGVVNDFAFWDRVAKAAAEPGEPVPDDLLG